MTFYQLHDIVAEVSYKPGWWVSTGFMNDGFYLQWRFQAPDHTALVLDEQEWGGRKWYVSPHATRSEVVQTLLKAALAAEEHEAREQFRYKGVAIFGPHHDVEALVANQVPEDRRAVA
jgi:hypothetical protein